MSARRDPLALKLFDDISLSAKENNNENRRLSPTQLKPRGILGDIFKMPDPIIEPKRIDTMPCDELDGVIKSIFEADFKENESPTSDISAGASLIFAHNIDILHIGNRSGQVVAQMRNARRAPGQQMITAVADKSEGLYPQLIAATRCLLKSTCQNK